jgi:ribosome biogenesis GTPase
MSSFVQTQSINTAPAVGASPGQGVVIKKSQGIYEVEAAGRLVRCELSSRLRKDLIYPTAAPTSLRHRVQAVGEISQQDPVAIGDRVIFTPVGEKGGLITEVLPRRNALSRPAAGERPLEQVIAANVDQVVAVFAAAQPSPKWELLDRYIVAAEAAGVPTLLAVTKVDLLTASRSDELLRAAIDDYERLGYRAILTSTVSGAGLAELAAALQGGVSVFVGKSGVGKSSLLNAIEPGLGQRVNAVSNLTGKGKHTTSHLEMFALAGGGRVVDTPGMREFGLWQLDEAGLAAGFVEMRPHLGHCKFGLDCTHAHEPGCAVQAAVSSGAVSERRYHSYLRMLAD